jgi:hypothetical protein
MSLIVHLELPKQLAGLDISEAEDGYIIYQPDLDRVHYLNHSAVLILELCNGANSLPEIAELVRQAYGLDELPEKMVGDTVATLRDQGLIETTD